MGCGPSGQVDRALHLPTGQRISLELPTDSEVGLGDGLLFATGAEGGLFTLSLTGSVRVDTTPIFRGPASGPPGVGSNLVAGQEAGRVLYGTSTSRTASVEPTQPVGWYPVAVGDGFLAWVVAGGATGEDLWMLDVRDRHPEPRPVAATTASERHAVASGPWLSFVTEDTLVRVHVPSGRQETLATGTGFDAPPSSWHDVVCWEMRTEDVDIVCSDGVQRAGPGHQRWPSRWEKWLLYRQEDTVLLYTIP